MGTNLEIREGWYEPMHYNIFKSLCVLSLMTLLSVGCAAKPSGIVEEKETANFIVSSDPVIEQVEEIIEEKEKIEITETGLSIDLTNTKIEYLRNEDVDFNDLIVSLNYSDDTTKALSSEEYQISEIDTSEYGKKEVTVTYGEYVETFDVEVIFTVEDCETKTMYSTTSLNVRKGPSTSFESIGVLNLNDEAKITGVCDNGWSRIDYKGETAYTSTKYLSDKKVEVAPPIDASGITWIGNVSSDCRNKAISLWGKIPQNVKNALSETGCKVIVTTDSAYTEGHAGMYWPFTSGQNYCAIYAGSVGKVNIAMIHEVGHFVDDYVGIKTGTGSYLGMSHTAEFQQIYAEEVGRSGYPSWATDCVEDYFAEAFWKCCVSPGTTQSNLPRTYEYVMRVANMC